MTYLQTSYPMISTSSITTISTIPPISTVELIQEWDAAMQWSNLAKEMEVLLLEDLSKFAISHNINNASDNFKESKLVLRGLGL